ncbi:putative O-methyltransferase YrrM [Paraburkholderia sp. GAS199]|uniref:O-methyltransferase n=1 Tax=Paraburkholderia sp. GAS199 TaxID=3035126 RepID=UPI003D1F6001
MDQAVLGVLRVYHERIADAPAAPERRPSSAAPATGQFVKLLAASLDKPQILELGTSYGYLSIWLASAARASGGRLTSMELHDDKAAFAREMSEKAGLSAYVDFKVGNAVTLIEDLPFKLDFVLIDLWKDLYVPCLDALYPKLNAGAIIVADNMLCPGGEDARRYLDAVRAKPHMRSLSLPLGAGLEVSRYC